MKKVTGHLYKRGKFWIVAWQHNGIRHKESTHTGNKRDALTEQNRILAPFRLESQEATLSNLITRVEEAHAEHQRLDDADPALPLNTVWDAYEAASNRPDSGPVTLSNYESWWNRFHKWISDNRPERKELRDITNEDAQAYAGHLQTMVSPSTFNRHAFFLGLLFKVLKAPGRLHRNPFERENVTRKKAVQNVRDALTVEQLITVCSSVTGEMRTLFAIGVYCGLRLADAALLRWDSIDIAKNVVSLFPARPPAGATNASQFRFTLHSLTFCWRLLTKTATGSLCPKSPRSTSPITAPCHTRFRGSSSPAKSTP